LQGERLEPDPTALDTDALSRMQNEFPAGLSATGPGSLPKGAVVNAARGPDANGDYIGAAGLDMPSGTPSSFAMTSIGNRAA